MNEYLRKHYQNIPVLVTGGCGFIGSQLVHELVSSGAKVTIIDNLSTGSLNSIDSIKDKITFIHDDIRNESACMQATQNKVIIFHCAAFISAPDSCINPKECFDINVNGTLQILEAARKNKVKRIVFSSSAAVYGNQQNSLKEDDPCHPTSPYGCSKLIGELLCKQYAQQYALIAMILRYFNVWGESQNPQTPYAGVVARFLHSMKNNLPIQIYGDGSQTRDFIHVNDVVNANLYAGFWSDCYAGHIFNIASGASRTLLDLFNELRAQFPTYNHPIQFLDKRIGDVAYSQADCTKYLSIIQNTLSKEI